MSKSYVKLSQVSAALGIVANVGYNASALEIREAEAAARTLGLEAVALAVRHADDIARALCVAAPSRRAFDAAPFHGPNNSINRVITA